MSRTKKPRSKAYHPKPANIGGGLTVIAKCHERGQAAVPMTRERQNNVLIAYHQSMEAMTGGFAEPYHMDTIIYALDIGVVLAEQGMGLEHIELLRAAIDGIGRSKARYLDSGKIGFDGEALAAVKAAYQLHEAQLEVATLGELQAAIEEMHRRIEEFKQAA